MPDNVDISDLRKTANSFHIIAKRMSTNRCSELEIYSHNLCTYVAITLMNVAGFQHVGFQLAA